MSIFRCPICLEPLERGEKDYRCPRGHSYDRAREGYVHLLPANRKHAKDPGDDKAMAEARSRFLSKGYYSCLRETLEELALAYTGQAPAVLDSGCGEGYYTQGIWERLSGKGREVRLGGVDLSRPSLRRAAVRVKAGEFAIASVYHLPVADGEIDLLLNCFSPLALEEFRRVLRPGGIFLYVVPAPDHLWEMKEILYARPYANPDRVEEYPGLTYLQTAETGQDLSLPGEDLHCLFQMTPYAWKTPREGVERLEGLEKLDVRARFRVHVYRKE